MTHYEYKFIILRRPFLGWTLSDLLRCRRDTIAEHGRDGWRLVQVVGVDHHRTDELIFEREMA